MNKENINVQNPEISDDGDLIIKISKSDTEDNSGRTLIVPLDFSKIPTGKKDEKGKKSKNKLEIYYPPDIDPSEAHEIIESAAQKIVEVAKRQNENNARLEAFKINYTRITSDAYSFVFDDLHKSIITSGKSHFSFPVLPALPRTRIYRYGRRYHKSASYRRIIRHPRFNYKFDKDLLIRAFLYSESFRTAIMSGQYIYYNEQLWLYSPDVIHIEGNSIKISEKALKDPHTYCLGLREDFSYNPFPEWDVLTNQYRTSYTELFNVAEMITRMSSHSIWDLVKNDLTEKREKLSVLFSEIYEFFTEISGVTPENIVFAIRTGKHSTSDNQNNGSIKEIDNLTEIQNGFININEADFNRKIFSIVSDICHARGFDEKALFAKAMKNVFLQAANRPKIDKKEYNSFAECFSDVLESKKLSTKDVFELTGIPEKTIDRMKTKDNYKPTLEYIVICIIALEIMPWQGEKLIYLAGYVLRKNIAQESFYSSFVYVFCVFGSVELCDVLLSFNHLPTLKSYIEKNRKDSE